jgi:hypothetical protein
VRLDTDKVVDIIVDEAPTGSAHVREGMRVNCNERGTNRQRHPRLHKNGNWTDKQM